MRLLLVFLLSLLALNCASTSNLKENKKVLDFDLDSLYIDEVSFEEDTFIVETVTLTVDEYEEMMHKLTLAELNYINAEKKLQVCKDLYSVYHVKPGDTLTRISAKELNNPDRWIEIFQINKKAGLVDDQDLIYAYQILYLPPR